MVSVLFPARGMDPGRSTSIGKLTSYRSLSAPEGSKSWNVCKKARKISNNPLDRLEDASKIPVRDFSQTFFGSQEKRP